MKFGHIGIYISDVEKSLEFYTKVLGCKVIKDYQYPNSRLLFLDAHGIIIELVYKADNVIRPIGLKEHLAFKVDSLDEKIQELKNFGIELDGEPAIVGKARIGFFNGPDNERFEFVERIEG